MVLNVLFRIIFHIIISTLEKNSKCMNCRAHRPLMYFKQLIQTSIDFYKHLCISQHRNDLPHDEVPLIKFLNEKSSMNLVDFLEVHKTAPILTLETETNQRTLYSTFSPPLYPPMARDNTFHHRPVAFRHSFATRMHLVSYKCDIRTITFKLQEKYQQLISEHRLYGDQMSRIGSRHISFHIMEITAPEMRLLWNKYYELYRESLDTKTKHLCDFVFELIFTKTNLNVLNTSMARYSVPLNYITEIQRLFLIFTHLIRFKFLESGAIDLCDNFIMDLLLELREFIEIHCRSFSEYDNCMNFLMYIMPKYLFSSQLITTSINEHTYDALMIMTNRRLPLFYIQDIDIPIIIECYQTNPELEKLNSWIFIKKKNVPRDIQIPLAFYAFGKKFNLVSIQILAESGPISASTDETRDCTSPDRSLRKNIGEWFSTNNVSKEIIDACRNRLVILFYDIE